MKKMSLLLSTLLLTTISISFPSVCFSELKTIEGESCYISLHNLDGGRYITRTLSIKNGLKKIFNDNKLEKDSVIDCIKDSAYLEKVQVISHTEKGRKICEKVKITVDTEVIKKVLEENICPQKDVFDDIFEMYEWFGSFIESDKEKHKQYTAGLIVDLKIENPNLTESEREKFQDEKEEEFYRFMLSHTKRIKIADRRNLNKVLEEQKLSSSGLTDNETVKIGKLLNLDFL